MRRHRVIVAAALVIAAPLRLPLGAQGAADSLWRDVEIIRTTGGVPHVRAASLKSAGYALGWLMLEDYGPRTAQGVLRSSGRMGLVFGRDSMDSDFLERITRARAAASYGQLQQDTRDVYEGFAAGLNRYITMHRAEFAAEMPADFTGIDILAGDMGGPAYASVRRYLAKLEATGSRAGTRGAGRSATDVASAAPTGRSAATAEVATGGARDDATTAVAADPDARDNVGSNAWAFAPSRTTSGRAILLRNPHLAWSAGYYEAHVTVPGHFDFYGDFRIGGPLTLIGGFNAHLGWSTTNNAQVLQELYAIDVDPADSDRFMLDGASHALRRESVTVPVRTAAGIVHETRDFWFTDYGPVVHRANGKVYVLKTANDGEYRNGEQFLRMMHARSLNEWKAAMRLHARATSNFTYADRAGNILLVWNAALPLLPHPSGGDTAAVPAHRAADIWSRYVPWDSLPQFLNPAGGYVHNENSSPHYTNVRQPVDTVNRQPNFEKPSLSLRSQLALQLVSGDDRLSLDDVVRRKHSYRMLLADRVKRDLIAAIVATSPSGEVADGLRLLEQWDNTAAAESKGAVLFDTWWNRYAQGLPDSLRFAKAWTSAEPLTTPHGLAQPARAAEAFAWAVAETTRRHGTLDVPWGAVHRVRRGPVDVPVGGCGGALGCFRVLNFQRDPDGRLAANGGDGWVLAVEFGDTPRAYSVLAYGNSNRPESPWYSSQAEMFARGELKPVAYTLADIEKAAVVRYQPGKGN